MGRGLELDDDEYRNHVDTFEPVCPHCTAVQDWTVPRGTHVSEREHEQVWHQCVACQRHFLVERDSEGFYSTWYATQREGLVRWRARARAARRREVAHAAAG